MKCGVLYFTKKVISRKNRDFLKIPNFSKFPIFDKTPRKWRPLDENSREFVSTRALKMQEYTGFPEFSSQNSEFSREIFVKIFSFHENRGSTFSRIPGNFGRQNTQKCKNIRVSRNSRAEIQIFPGKFLRKFGIFTKFRGHPSRNSREFWSKKPRKMQKYTGFTSFWGVKFRFSREFWSIRRHTSKKWPYTPGGSLQEYTGFPVPPGAHFGP